MRASISCFAMLLSPAAAAVVQRPGSIVRSPEAQPGAVLARQAPAPSASVIASIPANGTITTGVSSVIAPVPVLAVSKPDCTPSTICKDMINLECMKRYGACYDLNSCNGKPAQTSKPVCS